MTGRLGCQTMDMIGGSSAPYLAYALAFPCFVLCLIAAETEGLLDYQGRAGMISIVRWKLRPVISGVEAVPKVGNRKTLKTATSLNEEGRLLKFLFPSAIIVCGDNELKCSKCYDRKAKIALKTSKCCNR